MDTERKALTLLTTGAIAFGAAYPDKAEARSPQNLLQDTDTSTHLNIGPIANIETQLPFMEEQRENNRRVILNERIWELPENSAFTESEGNITSLTPEQAVELASTPEYQSLIAEQYQLSSDVIANFNLDNPVFFTNVALIEDENSIHAVAFLTFTEANGNIGVIYRVQPEEGGVFMALPFYIQPGDTFSVAETETGFVPTFSVQEDPGIYTFTAPEEGQNQVGIVQLEESEIITISDPITFPHTITAVGGSANIRSGPSTSSEDIGDVTQTTLAVVYGVTDVENYPWFVVTTGQENEGGDPEIGFVRGDVSENPPQQVVGNPGASEVTPVPQDVLANAQPERFAIDYADRGETPWVAYNITEAEYTEAETAALGLLPSVLQARANLPDTDPMAIQYNHSRLGFVDNQNRVWRPEMATGESAIESGWQNELDRLTVQVDRDGETHTVTFLLETNLDQARQVRENGNTPFNNAYFSESFDEELTIWLEGLSEQEFANFDGRTFPVGIATDPSVTPTLEILSGAAPGEASRNPSSAFGDARLFDGTRHYVIFNQYNNEGNLSFSFCTVLSKIRNGMGNYLLANDDQRTRDMFNAWTDLNSDYSLSRTIIEVEQLRFQ